MATLNVPSYDLGGAETAEIARREAYLVAIEGFVVFAEERGAAGTGIDAGHAERRAGKGELAGGGMFDSLEVVSGAELLRLQQIADGVDESYGRAGGAGGSVGLARVLAARPFVNDRFQLVVVLEAGVGVLEALIFDELGPADRLHEPGPVARHDVQPQKAVLRRKDADHGREDVATAFGDIPLEIGPPRKVELERRRHALLG